MPARICMNCGRTGADYPIVSLDDAMSPDMGVCLNCADMLRRRSVASRALDQESDRQLKAAPASQAFRPYMPKRVHKPKCGHCGSLVLLDWHGRQPAWCAGCEESRRRLMARG